MNRFFVKIIPIMIVFGAILCLSCAAAKPGTPDWIAKEYSAALLNSNTEIMRRYVASGRFIKDEAKNEFATRLHIIRLCRQGGNEEETRKRYLVLFGGKLDGKVYGIDVIMIKEAAWKVYDARLSKNAVGVPVLYLRNCGIDTGTGGY